MSTETHDAAEQRQKRESKMYRMAAGALLVVLLSFGLLQLYGVIHV
jgi:hypothetical protein